MNRQQPFFRQNSVVGMEGETGPLGPASFHNPPRIVYGEIQELAGTDVTANITVGVKQVTLTGGHYTTKFAVGYSVVATGVPTGATIASIESATQFTLSASATATATGVDMRVNIIAARGVPFTANITSGSAVVTNSSLLTSSMAVGHSVIGIGIQAGTTVKSIQSPTQFTLSANATATAVGSSLRIGLITGGSVAYCWQEMSFSDYGVIGTNTRGLASGGVCAPLATQSKTGYAWEVNGDDSLTAGTIVRLEPTGTRDAAGESWRVVAMSPGGLAASGTLLYVVTDVCLSGADLTVEKTPILATVAGPATCATNPTGCCPCTDAPGAFTITLTSSCTDLNDIEVEVAWDETEQAWIGTATTPKAVAVQVRVTYSTANGWEVDIYYGGVLSISCTATVTGCSPLTFTLTCINGCFNCEGLGSGSYSGGGSGGGGGNYTSPCCDVGVPLTLCLQSSIVSGSCADLDAWETLLTFDKTDTYTSADTFPYCVSPFHSGCTAMAVSPVLVCGEGVWSFGFARADYDTIILATLPTGDLCNGTPLVFDVVFDSTGATFPPGVDDGCCVATVRFTINADLAACGLSATGCCPGGTPTTLFVTGTDGSAATLTWDSTDTSWHGPNTGTGNTCDNFDMKLQCNGAQWFFYDQYTDVTCVASNSAAPSSENCNGNFTFTIVVTGIIYTIVP